MRLHGRVHPAPHWKWGWWGDRPRSWAGKAPRRQFRPRRTPAGRTAWAPPWRGETVPPSGTCPRNQAGGPHGGASPLPPPPACAGPSQPSRTRGRKRGKDGWGSGGIRPRPHSALEHPPGLNGAAPRRRRVILEVREARPPGWLYWTGGTYLALGGPWVAVKEFTVSFMATITAVMIVSLVSYLLDRFLRPVCRIYGWARRHPGLREWCTVVEVCFTRW